MVGGAYQQRDSGLNGIAYDPLLAGLKGDPRYGALLQKLNWRTEGRFETVPSSIVLESKSRYSMSKQRANNSAARLELANGTVPHNRRAIQADWAEYGSRGERDCKQPKSQ